MKKLLFAALAFVVFSSHDMFLKMDTFFLAPDTEATIKLYNGTFEESDNTIDRDRMVDVSLVGGGTRTRLDTNQWSERDEMTLLSLRTGAAGTYVAGVSTRARSIELDAESFNGYLEHDGVVDMLEQRKNEGTMDQDAVEKYSKHVKAIFQVGGERSDDWQTELGYPIEFVPLSNPYDLKAGDELRVRLLRDGTPLPDQLVYAGSGKAVHAHGNDHDHEHSHAEGADHDHTAGTTQLRTDADGVVTMSADHDGIWYLRTIHLVDSDEEGLTHESNWATLTFEVGHGHAEGANHHHHAAESSAGGLPGYVYWGGSLLVVAGLFFYFNRRG